MGAISRHAFAGDRGRGVYAFRPGPGDGIAGPLERLGGVLADGLGEGGQLLEAGSECGDVAEEDLASDLELEELVCGWVLGHGLLLCWRTEN
jgi:hypothetical protein